MADVYLYRPFHRQERAVTREEFYRRLVWDLRLKDFLSRNCTAISDVPLNEAHYARICTALERGSAVNFDSGGHYRIDRRAA